MLAKTVPYLQPSCLRVILQSRPLLLDSRVLALVQGLLGVRGRDAAAAGFSQEAAQALRAGVQEDFELFEASEDESQLEEGTANDSQGGKPTPCRHRCSHACIPEKAFHVFKLLTKPVASSSNLS